MFLWAIIFYGLVFSVSSECQNGGEQILLLELKDITIGRFSPNLATTGLENENDPTANTYSIIGNQNPEDFRINDLYEFYLVYGGTLGGHNPVDPIELRWEQSTWLTEIFNADGGLNYAPDFNEISFNPPDVSGGDDKFYGLGIDPSLDGYCYVDGTSGGPDWFNCVGAMQSWGNPGIASYNRGSSRSEALYGCKIDPCAHVSCGPEEICEEGLCVRDCGVFAIDDFLVDCSTEFAVQNTEIATLNERIDSEVQTLNNARNTLQTQLHQAIDDDVSALKTELESKIDSDIAGLQSQIDTINAMVSQFHNKVKTKSAAAFGMENSLGDRYEYRNDNKPVETWTWMEMLLIIIAVLLLCNITFMTYTNCCYKKGEVRYNKVRYMDSEDIDSEANLK